MQQLYVNEFGSNRLLRAFFINGGKAVVFEYPRLVLPCSRRLPGKDEKEDQRPGAVKISEIFLTSEGGLTEIIEGKLYPVKEGDVSILPSNIEHGAQIREVDFKAIDIFVPPREDYLEKRCKALKSTPDGVRFY